jgi:hypothetical protein
MASKTPETRDASKEAAADKKAAKKAAKRHQTFENATKNVAADLGCGHQSISSLLVRIAAIMAAYELEFDAVLRNVIRHSLNTKGVVLCVTEDTPAIEFNRVTHETLEQLNKRSEQIPPKLGHDHEFKQNGLSLVMGFYDSVIGNLSTQLADMYSGGFGDMNSDKIGELLQMVVDACKCVRIDGLCVEGMYIGPNANSFVCSWKKDSVHYYSFRALLKSVDEIIGHSMAAILKPPTHLVVSNGYLRFATNNAEPTPTSYAEVTITFELNRGIITVRPGTWFPSNLNAEAAAAGVEKFAIMSSKK